MNKIKVVNNKIIPFVSDDVEINDNNINFNNNGNYFIDYIDCNNVSLCINVNNNKCIHLFEYSNNNDINFTTSNIDWCETTINNVYHKQYIVSFKIYFVAYGAVYNFVFFKMLEDYFYSKFILGANSFLNKRI